jgi:hypothetical protein
MERPVFRALSLVVFAVAGPGCKVGRETVVDGYDRRWAQLDFGEKMAVMTDVVEPRMRAEFQAFDAERFANFSCETCHGAGASDGTYAMPNPDLPHLWEKGWFKKHRKETPKTVRFMWKDVELTMSDLLGVSTGSGGELACWTCHVVEDHEPG